MIKNFQFKEGFTLVEMLITLSLVGILTSVSFMSYRGQIDKANDGQRKKELSRLKSVLEDYYSDNNCYPGSLPNCGQSFEPYLPQMVCEPGGKNSYLYVPEGGASCPQSYQIFTRLTNTTDPAINQIGCTSGCGPGEAYNWGVSSDNVSVGVIVPEEGEPESPAPSASGGAGEPESPAPSEETCSMYTACFGIQCNSIPGPDSCSNTSFCSGNCSGGCEQDGEPIASKQCN